MKNFFKRIADRYRATSNAFKAGVNTSWQAFLAAFGLSLLGFISKVQDWASSSDQQFPSINPLGKGLASAVAGLSAGLIALVFRSVKPGPQYAGSTPIAPELPIDPDDRADINPDAA